MIVANNLISCIWVSYSLVNQRFIPITLHRKSPADEDERVDLHVMLLSCGESQPTLPQ